MLLACLCRNVSIVKDQADFGKLSNRQNSYLGCDITFSLPSPVSFENGFLDCVGHQISSSSQIFSTVSGAMIRNCTFKLEKQFATTIDATTMTNVTIVTSEAFGCQTSISNSEFHGVRIYTKSRFAVSATSTLFVGCSLGILVKQSDKNQSFIENMTNCTAQNCFLNASISVNDFVSVGGLALYSTDVLLLKSRFVSNITAQVTTNDTYIFMKLGGCVATGFKTLVIRDCDFLSTMLVAGRVSAAGGVLAVSNHNQNLSVYNISSYLSFLDSLGSSCKNIGNVVAEVSAEVANLSKISTFSNIRIQTFVGAVAYNQLVKASGVIAYCLTEVIQMTECFASGTISLDMGTSTSANAAGYIASAYGSSRSQTTLQNVCFSGEIHVVTQEGASELTAGGIFGSTEMCKIIHSHVHGDIRATKNSNNLMYVSALLAFGESGVLVDSCSAAANVTVAVRNSKTQNYVGCLAATGQNITNSFASCILSIAQTGDDISKMCVGMLSGKHGLFAANCSADGDMVFKMADAISMQGVVGGLIGRCDSDAILMNLSISGRIKAPDGFTSISSAFGSIFRSNVSSIVVAVDVLMPNANIYAYDDTYERSTIVNMFVDCSRTGNADQPKLCRSDLTTDSTLPMLGKAFAWNAAYNGGYPYLAALPVLDANRKYVLPNSGDFSADSYFVDDAGFPFPKTDFQPCRGVCYGTYSSPVIRTCDDDFEYCLDVDRAIREFPDNSCIADNAVCSSGASFCSSEAELLVVAAMSERACQKACPGCYNGYCSQSKCVCDVYNEGDACTFNCRADKPNCFGDNLLVCDMQNASCIVPPSCDEIKCVHGSCIDEPIAHCECDGLWAGDDCGSCRDGFDPATNCEKCKAAMEVINGICACGQAGVVCEDSYFCSSGSCQKNCMLLDKNCTNCDSNKLDLCGGCQNGLVLKNGVCLVPKKSSVAAIAGGVVGGCVAIAVVCAIVIFVLKSRKANGESSSKNETKANPRKDRKLKSVQLAVGNSGRPLGEQKQAYTVTSGGNDGKADP